jgi:hypothetical protein
VEFLEGESDGGLRKGMRLTRGPVTSAAGIGEGKARARSGLRRGAGLGPREERAREEEKETRPRAGEKAGRR